MASTTKSHSKELFAAILALESLDDAERFFADLCTPAEVGDMADRWRVAQLLEKGIPYRDIYQRTGVSTATVTRVARALRLGRQGYRRVLDRLNGSGKEAG